MRRASLFVLVPLFVLCACFSPGAAIADKIAFQPQNYKIVSDIPEFIEENRVFFRHIDTPGYPPDGDDMTADAAQEGYYREMASFTTYDELPAGGVMGIFWLGGPSGFGDAEFDCEPFEFPMDPLYDPVESVIFKKGESTIRRRSFTYLVFDLTQYRNRTVKEAILSFEVAPWYTGKAAQNSTTHPVLSVYDMHHAHENMIDDSKRHSFAGMVESPGSFPVEFAFPHPYTDYIPISGKVTASVIEDLGQEGNGYVGFLLSSENIDEEPGIQFIGIRDFKLEVDFGGTADIVPVAVKLYYPHVKTTGGWGAEVCAVNTNDAGTINGAFTAYDEDGNKVGDEIDVVLAAKGRRQIDVAAEFADHENIRYVVFAADKGGAVGYLKNYKENKYRSAVPAASEVNGNNPFVTHIASSSTWKTEIALINTTDSKRTYTLAFDTGETRDIELEGGAYRFFSIAELFGGQVQPNIKTAEILNGAGTVGIELFTCESANTMDGILLTDDAAYTMYFPHTATVRGWGTAVVAYNPDDKPCQLTVTPYAEDGTELASVEPDPVAPKDKYVELIDRLGLPAETAWVKVSADTPIAGFELFTQTNQMAGHTGIHISGRKGVFPKIEKAAGGGTGIALVNIGNSPASVKLTAHNDAGAKVSEATRNLDPFAKEVKLAKDIFSDIANATYIRYESDKEVAGFQLNTAGPYLDALQGLKGELSQPSYSNYNISISLWDHLERHGIGDAEIRLFGRQGITESYGKTDSNGNVSFSISGAEMDETNGAYVFRHGYLEKMVYWKDAVKNAENYSFEIRTIKRDAKLPELTEATLSFDGSTVDYDILSEPVDIIQFKPDRIGISIKAKSNGWKIRGYRLQQGTVSIKNSEPEFKSIQVGAKFKPGMPIYAVVETDFGDVSSYTPLRVRIRSNPKLDDPLPTVPPTSQFTVGDVPFLKDLGFSVEFPSFPIHAVIEDNKMTLLVGIENKYENFERVNFAKIKKDLDEALKSRDSAKKYLQENGGAFKNMGGAWAWGGSVGALGFLEMEIGSEGGLTLVGGGLAIMLDGHAEYTQQFMIVVVPAYVSGTLGAGFTVTFAYQDDMEELKDFFMPTITLEPYLELEAGVGLRGILSVGVAGRGSMPITYDVGKGDFKMELTAGAELRATAFVIFNYHLKIVEKTWQVIPKDKIEDTFFVDGTPPDLFSMDSYMVPVKEALEPEWFGYDDPPPMTGPIQEQVLQNRLGAGTEPKLLKLGRYEILLWIDDQLYNNDPKRRLVLVFSWRKQGEKFSSPKPVHDKKMNDVDFDATVHKGKLYVTWQGTDVAIEPEKTNLKDICENSTVYVAHAKPTLYSYKFSELADMHVPGLYFSRPRFGRNNDNLGIFYSTNSELDYFGKTGSNAVRSHVLNKREDRFEYYAQLHATQKPIVSFAAAMDRSEPKIALIEDTDGDLRTINDRILIVVGKESSTPIVKNPSVIGNPKFATLNGNHALFWYQESNIFYHASPFSGGSQTFSVFKETESSLGDDYDLMSEPEGNVRAVLWTNSDRHGNSEAFAGFYSGKSHNWGEPVPLTRSGARMEAPHGYIETDGSVGLVYRKLKYDPTSKIYSGDKSELAISFIKPSMDLALAENAIYGSPDSQVPGKDYPFQFTVSNLGTLPCGGIRLEVFNEAEKKVWSENYPEHLMPGESVTLKGKYPVPNPLTKHDFSIKVTPVQGKDEGISPKKASYTVGIARARIMRASVWRQPDLSGRMMRHTRVLLENLNGVRIPKARLEVKDDEGRTAGPSGPWVLEPLEVKKIEWTEPVEKETDDDFNKRRTYSLHIEGVDCIPPGKYNNVSVNPFKLNPLTPSILIAESRGDGTILISVSVQNNHPVARQGVLCIELYDGDRFVESSSRKIQLLPNGNGQYIAVFGVSGDPTRYKAKATVNETSLPRSLGLTALDLAVDEVEEGVITGW